MVKIKVKSLSDGTWLGDFVDTSFLKNNNLIESYNWIKANADLKYSKK